MLNNFDILKNGLYDLFNETIYRNCLIRLENYENDISLDMNGKPIKMLDKSGFQLLNNEIEYNIENSTILKMIVDNLKKYDIGIFYSINDLDNIKCAYNDFENEFIKKFEIEL